MLTAKAPKSHSQQVQSGPRALEGHRGTTALVLLLLAVAFYWGGGGGVGGAGLLDSHAASR